VSHSRIAHAFLRFTAWRRLRASVVDWAASVPAIGTWEVAQDFALPKGFKCKQHPGLLQCHVARAEHASKLITVWRSPRHLAVHQNAFARAVSLPEKDMWVGDLADLRTLSTGLRPVSLFDAVKNAAAILGACAVLYQAYGYFWTSPDVVATLPAETVDAVQDRDFEFSIALTNEDLQKTVTVRSVALSGPSGVRLRPAEQFFAIEPGKRHELRILGKAERGGDGQLLKIDTTVKGGKFRKEAVIHSQVPLRVWPTFSFTRFAASPTKCDKTLCRAEALLSFGEAAPAGIECYAILDGGPQVHIFAAMNAVAGADPTPSPDGTVKRIDWREGPDQAFQQRSSVLVLRSDRPIADWNPVIAKVTNRCERL
jgi:hypothetical protein